MANKSKRYEEALQKVDRGRLYGLEEAVEALKSMKAAKFDETVEVSVQLGIDPKQSDQQVRGSISLPHGIGRQRTVAVFTSGENVDVAKAAGADYVGGADLAEKIEGGWMEFDVALATPDMLRIVGKLGRHLGPRGLMPTPKNGTVRQDIADAVKEFKAGKIELRSDEGGNIHAAVGKMSFSAQAILENVREVIEQLMRLKPIGCKGKYIKKLVVSSTMGPGIKIKV